MLKNYIKTAIRSLLRNKVYSIINILGLSFGLACAMLIILYRKDELSFDRFHANTDRLYRIISQETSPDGSRTQKMGITGFLQGPRFIARVPEIEAFVRVRNSYRDLKTGQEIKSQAVVLADSNFFSMFSFPFVSGDPRTALLQPNSVVITETVAFGLSVLSAERRTKEIGIRKVLGASVGAVVSILSKDFLKLVILSLLIAIPLSWMAAERWLEHYPYRIRLGWEIFALTGLAVVGIAISTVSFQSIRAALANPVESLRSE